MELTSSLAVIRPSASFFAIRWMASAYFYQTYFVMKGGSTSRNSK